MAFFVGEDPQRPVGTVHSKHGGIGMKVAFVYPEVYDVARFGKKRKEFPPFGVLYLATIVSGFVE